MAEATLRDINIDHLRRRNNRKQNLEDGFGIGTGVIAGITSAIISTEIFTELASELIHPQGLMSYLPSTIIVGTAVIQSTVIGLCGGAALGGIIGNATYHLRELITESANRRTGYVI